LVVTLLPPRVIGPLSECNHVVRVEGQLTGATVHVYANGHEVAGAVATWSKQDIALSPGQTLQAGDSVTAAQKTSSDSSGESPNPIVVQAKPPQIGAVVFYDPIYECNQMTGIVGAVPGSTVEIHVGSQVRGGAVAVDGTAAIPLSPATGAGDILVARQTACGAQGPDTQAPPPEHTDKLLPTPKIVSPLYACQTSVTIENLLSGAETTLVRSGGPSASGAWTEEKIDFVVDPPLVEGETLTATQSFPTCRYESAKSTTATVEKADPVPPPLLNGPLCAGATSVYLTDLIPGSEVRILSDGQMLGTGQAPADSFVFDTPALTAGATIAAEQQLCGKWGNKSNVLVVTDVGGDLPKPVVATPLNDCAGSVHVTNVHPGAWVYVSSKALGAPIGQTLALGSWVDVTVQPLLFAGDEIHAQCLGCGKTGPSSDPVNVGPTLKALKPPTVSKPVEKETAVTVVNVTPGATVDMYVNSAFRGRRTCTQQTAQIPITGSLVIGDKVKARQRLCNVISTFGSEVVTVPLPPVAHFSASPTSGNVPLAVQFTDESTGVINSWNWHFGDGGMSTSPNPSHTFSAAHGGVYPVTLTVKNSGNVPSTASVSITAKPLPPVAHFSASPTSGQAPLTVHFTDQSAGVIDSWKWTFGDNQTSSAPSPSHNYVMGGNLPVTLTVKNFGNAPSTATASISVTAPQQPPSIVVSRGTEQITVVGSHFPPNAAILIRLTDAYTQQTSYGTASTSFGTFNLTIPVPGCTGLNNNPLYVKASSDNGTTWSNTYTVTC
jgi:PKD repeat protein